MISQSRPQPVITSLKQLEADQNTDGVRRGDNWSDPAYGPSLTSATEYVPGSSLLRRLARLVPPSRIDTVRPGYDPDFLGKKRPISLPGVNGAVAVLRYLHFTVVMNPARRLAHYVA
jgi:hypothetical protein